MSRDVRSHRRASIDRGTQTTDLPKTWIAINSRIPPPYGGVSTHVLRLARLAQSAGIRVRVYDQGGARSEDGLVHPTSPSPSSFLRFLLTVPAHAVHLHTTNLLALMLAPRLLRLRGISTIVTLHNRKFADATSHWKRIAQALGVWALRKFDLIVVVTPDLCNALTSRGVPAKKIALIPAYLPPRDDELSPDLVPAELRAFADTHEPLIASQGWFGNFVRGRHVYQFDELALLIARVRNDCPRAGLVTLVSGCLDAGHREMILDLRRSRRLEDCWMIWNGDFPAPALYGRSSIFVRPTITDGDSVSVRECLELGVPVVASDAVPRPPGCVLYETQDRDALYSLVMRHLSARRSPSRRTDSSASVGAREHLEVYHRIVGTSPHAQETSRGK